MPRRILALLQPQSLPLQEPSFFAVPLVQAAARVLRDVATFDSAGVSGAKE